MSRFTTIKTADYGFSEIFARNLQLDENTMSEIFQAGPIKVQTAIQVSHTDDNRVYQKNTQPQEANGPLNSAGKAIQGLIPINPHAVLLRPKACPRITASSLLPRHGLIHQHRDNQYHRRYPKSEKLLRCHYAPWAPATTMTSGLCSLFQHLTTSPPHPRSSNTTTPSGLGKRRRVDWSNMIDDVASKAGGLDTILEEEVDKNGDEERQESGRFKRQRRL